MPITESQTTELPKIEIGLVMAGAVSAGAYTGGAIDFLLQALDAWTAAKENGDGPLHDFKMKVVTGASAGGMTAAMLATTLSEPVPPVTVSTSDDLRPRNKFYNAWVNQVSIEKLLEGNDLANGDEKVISALDCTVLDNIAQGMITPGPDQLNTPRKYISDPLVVALTATNLRGVPYEIKFQGLAGTQMPYGMTLHADDVTFAVSSGDSPEPVEIGLEAITPANKAVQLNSKKVGQGDWNTLANAALATGAFPFGLAPRTLHRRADHYNNRQWYHPNIRINSDGETEVGYYAPMAHAMNVKPEYDYRFTCVDGGMIDNEPMGIAREHLNWQSPVESRDPSAILMIDPFPNMTSFDPKYDFPEEFNLFKLFPTILGTLISQARFKPEELTRALDPKVFNQFMLSPVRRLPGKSVPEKFSIACGGLGGFAGFLHEDFRRHDYFLGRSNMQSFLRRHFVLPESNVLFGKWSDSMKNTWRVRRDAHDRVVEHEATGDFVYDADGKRQTPVEPLTSYLPIIPLMPELQVPEKTEAWPRYPSDKLSDLRERIESRSKLVVERLISGMKGMLAKFLLRRAWWLKRDEFIDLVTEKIQKELQEQKLLG